jgi:ABC-type cobalamin/Fe3+-siderophores transport system ATPase subunit
MSGGRIVADGRPSETLDPGHIRSVFGVDPALVRMPVLSA